MPNTFRGAAGGAGGGGVSVRLLLLWVGWDRGALPGLLLVGFPDPPAAPGVRLSPHRALHVPWPLDQPDGPADGSGYGEGICVPR
jgi:hypothetical protein